MITEEMVENARSEIKSAVKLSELYLGKTDHWVIAPIPDYFDGGSGEPGFAIYRARADGQEGECIFVSSSEWECYQVYVELFGDEFVRRSADYSYIY